MNAYGSIIEKVFQKYYRPGLTEFDFKREDVIEAAALLELDRPKNVGDVIYSFRYRNDLPKSISATATGDCEWMIEGAGSGAYRFKQAKVNRIIPRSDLLAIKIPESTPEIIGAYALGDEQALLAKLRYNRLIDIFLSITAYSLQNHLRTTVKGIGQIEIDEIYVGVDRSGRQFVVPVQAKGGLDKHAVVQTLQDIQCCREKFPQLICRAVSAQFISREKIALFELTNVNREIKVVSEKHYELTPANSITDEDLKRYSITADV